MILHDHRHLYDFSKNHKIRRRFIRPIRDRMPYLPLAPLKPENLPNWKHIDYGVKHTYREDLRHDTKTFIAQHLRFRHLHLPIFVCNHRPSSLYPYRLSSLSASIVLVRRASTPPLHFSDGRRRPACDPDPGPGVGVVMVSFFLLTWPWAEV